MIFLESDYEHLAHQFQPYVHFFYTTCPVLARQLGITGSPGTVLYTKAYQHIGKVGPLFIKRRTYNVTIFFSVVEMA